MYRDLSRGTLALVLALGVSLVGAGCASDPPPPEPTTTPVGEGRVGLPESESYRAYFDEYWTAILSMHPGAVRPDTYIQRYVTPLDQPELLAACVNEAGFPARVVPDNGVLFGDIPEAQGEAQVVAIFACNARYPLDDRFRESWNEEQLRVFYDYQVNEMIPCLERFGVVITDIPTFERFVDTYGTAERWSPYGTVWDVIPSQEEQWEVVEACPQFPRELLE